MKKGQFIGYHDSYNQRIRVGDEVCWLVNDHLQYGYVVDGQTISNGEKGDKEMFVVFYGGWDKRFDCSSTCLSQSCIGLILISEYKDK
jgi:hypothetical protein